MFKNRLNATRGSVITNGKNPFSLLVKDLDMFGYQISSIRGMQDLESIKKFLRKNGDYYFNLSFYDQEYLTPNMNKMVATIKSSTTEKRRHGEYSSPINFITLFYLVNQKELYFKYGKTETDDKIKTFIKDFREKIKDEKQLVYKDLYKENDDFYFLTQNKESENMYIEMLKKEIKKFPDFNIKILSKKFDIINKRSKKNLKEFLGGMYE